jgi:hypothetical protein
VTYKPALREELSFGDVCDAEFLYDVHVRKDARAMGRQTAPAKFAKRWGREEETPYFVPGVDIRRDEHYVLAHGQHQQAVALSDDCLIATALGRDGGGPTTRRLLFAPVVDATEEQLEAVGDGNFGRFPLPADEHHYEHHIIDIRRCFMVDARDVHEALADDALRVRSLDDGTRDDLAIRWSAYALRRGPFVAEDSLAKFAEYLLASGHVADEQVAVDVATALADVVAAAWGYEGRGVEGAGTAQEDGRPPGDAVTTLVRELEQLHAVTDAALAALRGLR